MDDQIRSAFFKVKQDVFNLEKEMSSIRRELNELKLVLNSLNDSIYNLKIELFSNPTDRHSIPTHNRYPTDNPTVPQEIKGLKDQNIRFSTGNEGVPTDRQTDKQTDQQTQNTSFNSSFYQSQQKNNIETDIKEASDILYSLDKIKRDIRSKFKQLTSQEMLVFSTIYQLDEKDPKNNTYGQIAQLLHLSESSIRDYVLKMIKKGIPIKKEKVNNRKILLSISSELKKIATLSTIMQLREL